MGKNFLEIIRSEEGSFGGKFYNVLRLLQWYGPSCDLSLHLEKINVNECYQRLGWGGQGKGQYFFLAVKSLYFNVEKAGLILDKKKKTNKTRK